MTHKLKILILFIILLCNHPSLFAQGSGVDVYFRFSDTELKNEGLASNVLVIKNYTNQPQELQVKLSVPGGWRLWGDYIREIRVSARDSAFVPVRLTSAISLNGDDAYSVSAMVYSRGINIAGGLWTISYLRTSGWNAGLSSNRVFLPFNADSSSVFLSIINTGNSREFFEIEAEAAPGIGFKLGDKISSSVKRTAELLPGRDTLILFKVKLVHQPNKSVLQAQSYAEESYRVRFKVNNKPQSRAAARSYSASVEFFKLDSKVKVQPSRFNALPISAEFRTYNLVSDNSYAVLNLNGSKYFEKDNGTLNYYYQTDFVQNNIDYNSFLGNYHFIGYYNNTFSAEAGNISMNRGAAGLSGKGVRGSYTYRKHQLSAMFVRQPNFFDEPTAQGLGSTYSYRDKNLRAEIYGQLSQSEIRKTETTLVEGEVSYNFLKSHNVRVGGGVSAETHNWIADSSFVTNGFLGRFGYRTRINRFNYSLSGYYASKGYAVQNGVLSASSNFGYSINSFSNANLYGSYYQYEPERYIRGQLITDSIYNERTRLGLKYNKTSDVDGYGFGPMWQVMRSSYLHSDNYGFDFDYRFRAGNVGVFANAYTGVMEFPEYTDTNPIFVANARTSVRYNEINASVRYFYGPYTSMDQVQYLRTDFNPQKLYVNFSHDLWMAHNHINLNTGLNYFYNTYQQRHQFNLRPELFYFARNGFVFSLYGRYMIQGHGEYSREVTHQSENFSFTQPAVSYDYTEFGAGIKFNINLPASLPKNFDTRFIVFQDLNGNSVLDGREQGIANVMVKATLETPMSDIEGNDFNASTNEYSLITNNNGEVNFRNLPKGNYIIETIPLSVQGALSETKRFYRQISGNRTLFLPYSDGARVSGAVLIQLDQHGSQRNVQLNNLRITATNNADGQEYTTLTDRDGRFVLYLPIGDYYISVNESAINQRFTIADNNISLKVAGAAANYSISFQLIEAQRTIRMAQPVND